MKSQIHIKGLASAVIAVILLSSQVQAQCSIASNLLPNGTFESGNSGFTSAYGYNPGNLVPEGKLCFNTFDCDRSELLTVTIFNTVTFATFFLENDDFVTFNMF